LSHRALQILTVNLDLSPSLQFYFPSIVLILDHHSSCQSILIGALLDPLILLLLRTSLEAWGILTSLEVAVDFVKCL
jgi:hypothetical protein